jgi:dynein heavy chain
MVKHAEQWYAFLQEENFDKLEIPDLLDLDESLPLFSKILLIKYLRPELSMLAIKNYIAESLGSQFINPQLETLK